jgi:hypothetical protein
VPTSTEEGYETTFAVNHLGHYLLTRLLLLDFGHKTRALRSFQAERTTHALQWSLFLRLAHLLSVCGEIRRTPLVECSVPSFGLLEGLSATCSGD